MNYRKPLRLTWAEAATTVLFIIQHEDAARTIMTQFTLGHAFWDINLHLLERYAEAPDSSAVLAVQNEYIRACERETAVWTILACGELPELDEDESEECETELSDEQELSLRVDEQSQLAEAVEKRLTSEEHERECDVVKESMVDAKCKLERLYMQVGDSAQFSIVPVERLLHYRWNKLSHSYLRFFFVWWHSKGCQGRQK